ncbi:predicted protein [Naegleria gruberi]|uniref:Predicted protein n=1 Tax=Naegleria gruberi TaxID=5762 RepID=D2VZH8_NAEGR|nr:uncharacterized protein NAEGRDRAFT_74493 [Naegleria gruberi]EFC37793.1 predicted protein [Naegleria gruberi]|eukprot:XP_002670537.1 predicted protein [Naegleria gruberi strain NEG-M]
MKNEFSREYDLLLFIEEAIEAKIILPSSLSSNHHQNQPTSSTSSSQILHVYLYGSRAYFPSDEDQQQQQLGSNRDYDTVVIVENCTFIKLMNYCKTLQQEPSHHHTEENIKLEEFLLNSNKQYYKILYTFMRNNVEISMSIYSERIFQRMIQDHSIFILFCVHNRNSIVKWKETWNERVEGYNSNDLSLSECYYRKYFQKHKFVPSVLSEVNRAWQKFYNKIVKDHDESKGTKLVVYCFRFLAWATELLQYHCVDESVFSGNEIYWNLQQNVLDKFDRQDYKALYKTIDEEYGEKYSLTVDSFTKLSEFSSLYPNISLTKSETTEVIISDPSMVLKEMKQLLEGLNSIEDLYRLFSIYYKNSAQSQGIALSATDMSPRDYPIISLCINSSVNNSILFDTAQHSILKAIPFIPNIRIEMNESACREVMLKNSPGSTWHEIYTSRNHQNCFLVWWNFQSSKWCVNEATNLTLALRIFINYLPCLLNNDQFENYSITIQLENSNDITIIGFNYLEKSGNYRQQLVTKFEDFAPNIIFSKENFNRDEFNLTFRKPILKIQQPSVALTFDGYRTFVLNHDEIQDILHDNQVEVIEIFTYSSDVDTKPLYTSITTPSYNCLRKMKQVILDNGDCTLREVSQLPKHIKELCLEFTRWNLNINKLLEDIQLEFYGNTVEMICQQIELYSSLISNLRETIQKLSNISEPKLLDKNIKEIITSKQTVSLLKAILFRVQQKSSVGDIIIRCIRNTYRQRLLTLLEEVSKKPQQ